MTDSAKILNMAVADYLAGEEDRQIRHEYIDGQVFAMTGATEAHNRICGNLFAALHAHLRGSGCAVFMNDMKVRIEAANSFYYPDLMVTCEPYSAKAVFKDAPVLLIEVLSPSTKSTDRRQKLVAYKQIRGLRKYIVVYQDRRKVEVYCRNDDGPWQVIVLRQDDELVLDALGGKAFTILLEKIYEECDPMPSVVSESEAFYDEDSSH